MKIYAGNEVLWKQKCCNENIHLLNKPHKIEFQDWIHLHIYAFFEVALPY